MSDWPFLHKRRTWFHRTLQRAYQAGMKRATKRAMRHEQELMESAREMVQRAYEAGYARGLVHGQLGLLADADETRVH